MAAYLTSPFGIITVIFVIAAVIALCAACYWFGIRRGRDATARELDGLRTSLRLDSSQWRLAADERPYSRSERSAVLDLRQDRSRLAVRGRGDGIEWAGDGVAVGDQVAAVCVETGTDGRRASTLLLRAEGDELRGVRLTVSKKKGSVLVHPVVMTRR